MHLIAWTIVGKNKTKEKLQPQLQKKRGHADIKTEWLNAGLK
jgi:hypothetical protein